MQKNKIIVWILVLLVVLGLAAGGLGSIVASRPPQVAATP